jgi:hypothetical protein
MHFKNEHFPQSVPIKNEFLRFLSVRGGVYKSFFNSDLVKIGCPGGDMTFFGLE